MEPIIQAKYAKIQGMQRKCTELDSVKQTRENTAFVTVLVFGRFKLDCVGPGELGGVILHVEEGVVAGVLCVEDVGHGDGLVRSVTGSRVDGSLSNSGLTFGAAAASMADLQQTAGSLWNRLAAVHRLDSRLHLFPCREKVTASLEHR